MNKWIRTSDYLSFALYGALVIGAMAVATFAPGFIGGAIAGIAFGVGWFVAKARGEEESDERWRNE